MIGYRIPERETFRMLSFSLLQTERIALPRESVQFSCCPEAH